MIPFVTERREGIGGDFIVKRHSLCVDGVLRDIRKTRVVQQESSSTTSINSNVRTSRKHAFYMAMNLTWKCHVNLYSVLSGLTLKRLCVSCVRMVCRRSSV